MEKENNNNVQFQTQNFIVHCIKRHVIILSVVALVMATIACVDSPSWWLGEDEQEENIIDPTVAVIIGDSEPTTEVLEPAMPNQAVPMAEPDNKPGESQSSEGVTINAGINEYSVSAQDFNCICSVSGNVNVELHANGDQLEIIDPDGNAQVFDKIGKNTYKRSWMGYYILVENGQETQVDEEKSVIIILTNTGYVMEHYKGSEGSPCCIHTFTKQN